MKLNSKLTGGLAWAGLIVVLAVPSADMLTKPQPAASAHLTSDMEALQTASTATTPAKVEPARLVVPAISSTGASAAAKDPVDSYVSSGKKLPSYISDAPAEQAAVEPKTVTRLVVPAPTATTQPTLEVAAVEAPAAGAATVVVPDVAPIPYPASMRPKTQVAAAAPVIAPAKPVTTVLPASPQATAEEPLIVDETAVARRDAAVANVLADDDVEDVTATNEVVGSDELEQWDSGSLAEYLERKGMMSGSSEDQASRGTFDEDGFFLDEGPNNDRSNARVVRRTSPRSNFFLF